jgi:hypothetical protein
MGLEIDAVNAAFDLARERAPNNRLRLYPDRLREAADRGAGASVRFGRSTLTLAVWTLKREVRAFGGCLGMHRR